MLRITKTLLLIGVLNAYSCAAQLEEFNVRRHNIDENLMIGLGSWASVNIIGSGIGYFTAPNDEMKSFHQMNVMWNTVNLGLAIPGYIKARRAQSNSKFPQTLEEQRKTETIFMFNAGLDLAYISGGLILRSESRFNLEKQDLFKGYGNSLLIQGGFLLVFDWIAYGIHRQHAKKNLLPLLNKIELSDSGLGLKLKL